MRGAENAALFGTGQHGRLYLVSGSHARGNTFRIQVLPKGEEAIQNGPNNLCLNTDAVEVYGAVSGQPGWTEAYGWKHFGPWQMDFEVLLERRKKELIKLAEARDLRMAEKKEREQNRTEALLSKY